MNHKRIFALFALASLLFISSCTNSSALQSSEPPLTIYGIDFEQVNNLPACIQNDVNTDLNNYEGENALVLQPSPVACITPHLTCKVGEWAPSTFTFTLEQSTRIQGRVQTPNGVRAVYAMHTSSDRTSQTERFEIGVNDLVDADIQTYLNTKYGQPNLAQDNPSVMDAIAKLNNKLTPDTFLLWQVEHQAQSYLVYYVRVGEKQMIGGVRGCSRSACTW